MTEPAPTTSEPGPDDDGEVPAADKDPKRVVGDFGDGDQADKGGDSDTGAD